MFAHAFAGLLLVASSVHGLALPDVVQAVPRPMPMCSGQNITCGTATYFYKVFGGIGSCDVNIPNGPDYIGAMSAKYNPGADFCKYYPSIPSKKTSSQS